MPTLADEFALPEVAAPAARANLLDEFEAPPPRLTEDLTIDASHKALEWERTWEDAKSPERGVELIRKWVGDKAATVFRENVAKDWEELNTPKLKIPRLNVPSLEETPESMRPMQKPASVIAGTYNAVASVAESLTTPLNIGTLGTFGALQKVAAGTGPGARLAARALAAIKVAFGAEMAKGAGEQAGAASVTLADPDAPLQEKVEAGLSPVITGGLAIISAAHGGKDVIDVRRARAKVTPKTTAEMAEEFAPPAAEVAAEVPPKPPITVESIPPEARLPAETGEIQFTIQRPQEFDGRTIPGYTQIERRSNAGRGEPLAESERDPHTALSEEAIAAGIPTGQYTEAQLRQFIASKATPPPNVTAEFTAPPASEVVAVPEAITPEGATPEPLEAKTTSIKNAIVDQERIARGLPPAMDEAAREFPEVWDEAMKRIQQNPEAGDNLVADLKAKARPLTDVEDAILLRFQIEAQNEFAEVSKRIAEGRGTPEELIADRQAQSQLADDLLDVYNVGKSSGREAGRGLNARKMLADENYTLGQMVTLRRALKGGAELTPEELKQTEVLQAKIDELQTKFDAYRTRASELLMRDTPDAAPRRRSVGGRVMAALSEQAVAARARIKARLTEGRVSSGLDPTELADYAIIGADYIAKGIAKSAEWGEAMVKELGERIRPHLAAIRAKAEETIDEGGRTEAFKKRATTKIAELERRRAEGDFAKRERRPTIMDDEANLIQAQLDTAKDEFNAAMEKDKYDQLSATEKVWKQAVRGYDLQRVLQTTGELSFLLRQGAYSAASAPITTARAVPNAIRALFSNPVEARALDLQVFNHPDAKTALRSGVALVEHGEKLSRQEDIFAADLVEKVWGLRHIAQANRVFLNKLRFDLWRQLRNTLDETTPERDKALATFANESTGRGRLGKAEALAIPLGRVFYAPHFLMSRIQMLVGHSMWGGDLATRKVIAKQYAKFLVGMGAYYTAMSLITGDEKKKPTIELDPKSSDFGKVKIGDTRIDPLGGLAQVVVFASRTATGETTTASGKTTKYDPGRGTLRFLRTKLAPVPGSIVDLKLGTDVGGDPVTLESEAIDLIRPMAYRDIYEALKNTDDMSDEMAFTLLSLLGQGLQTYDANERRKKPIKPNPANKRPITVDDIQQP